MTRYIIVQNLQYSGINLLGTSFFYRTAQKIASQVASDWGFTKISEGNWVCKHKILGSDKFYEDSIKIIKV